MEPSWTEPPPFAWVFIGAYERAVCRRPGGTAAGEWGGAVLIDRARGVGGTLHTRLQGQAVGGRPAVNR
jgi:hypothetical protein